MEHALLPSRTSILVAAARALGARDPDPSVRNPDWLAERFIGPEELALIQEHPIGAAITKGYFDATQDYQVVGLMVLMIVRTRYIDEHLETAVRNGATQVVILGAGLDSRAYRFADLLQGVAVFELDAKPTQEYKMARVEAVLGKKPPNVVYAAIDFQSAGLMDVLRKAGYEPSQKTFFIWEGVSMYIPEDSVRRTLRSIAQSAAGSSLVMDFASQSARDMLSGNAGIPFTQTLNTWGEPWVFGIPDNREREFFCENGLELIELAPMFGPESMKRYLTRQDGSIVGLPRGVKEWKPPPELTSASIGAAVAARNPRFYAIAEAIVP
ncbi:MAG: SAM-dependent methyltransferase [Bryobacterales bacterium]|nr:SAM-dependent methyltransferase [Bryobacterales bacterium]MBV9398541.1 SAM-dependent methyltransferase [Bryobacterales bacterium]